MKEINSKEVSVNWIRCIKKVAFIVACIVVLISVMLAVYASGYAHADDRAESALVPTEKVNVELNEDFVVFAPSEGNGTGIVFYPGGKVEFTAYAPLLKKLAEEGIMCVDVRMPLNLAFFGINKADSVIEAYGDIDEWYIVGHSLGGVAASVYAEKNADDIDGLVLLSSYPTKPLGDLSVLSVYGSNDGVLNLEAYEEATENWTKDTKEVVILGGNHSQFGSYGFQKGDKEADISPDEQWQRVCEAVLEFNGRNREAGGR